MPSEQRLHWSTLFFDLAKQVKQFALPASLVVVAISQALMPRYAEIGTNGDHAPLADLMTTHAVAVAFCCLGVGLAAPPLLVLLTPEVFSGAADLVGWLVVGFLAFGLYLGANRYDLHFERFALELPRDRRERAAALGEVLQRFAGRLEHFTRLAPYNWFNLYDFWDTSIATSPPAVRPAAGERDAGA